MCRKKAQSSLKSKLNQGLKKLKERKSFAWGEKEDNSTKKLIKPEDYKSKVNDLRSKVLSLQKREINFLKTCLSREQKQKLNYLRI